MQSVVCSNEMPAQWKKQIGETMRQEDRDTANTALMLDELIANRVWEILGSDPYKFESMVLDAVSKSRWDPRLSEIITTIVKNKL